VIAALTFITPVTEGTVARVDAPPFDAGRSVHDIRSGVTCAGRNGIVSKMQMNEAMPR